MTSLQRRILALIKPRWLLLFTYCPLLREMRALPLPSLILNLFYSLVSFLVVVTVVLREKGFDFGPELSDLMADG